MLIVAIIILAIILILLVARSGTEGRPLPPQYGGSIDNGIDDEFQGAASGAGFEPDDAAYKSLSSSDDRGIPGGGDFGGGGAGGSWDDVDGDGD